MNRTGNKMDNVTANFTEYTTKRSDLTATERWTEETTYSTVPSDAGNKMDNVTPYFAEFTVNRSDLAEQWTKNYTNSTVFFEADMPLNAVWVVVCIALASAFVILLVVAIVAQVYRLRKHVQRRRSFRQSTSNSITVKFNPQSKPGEYQVNRQKPLASESSTSNTEHESRISGIRRSLENDIYEKDSDTGSCHLEISTFTAVNKNYVSKERLNVDDTTLNTIV